MARGKLLDNTEKAIIIKMSKDGKSNRAIARFLDRSARAVNNFLKKERENIVPAKLGRPSKISPRKRRAILKVASNSTLSLAKIKEKSDVDVHKSTVHRIIKASEHIQFRKLQKKPPLTKMHRDQRLLFCRDHMSWVVEWKKVVFTDEKKFNLDGPDGYHHYFHDLRKEELILSRRQMGGGSLMVWGAVSYNGVVDLEIISGRQDSRKYIDLLSRQRLKITEKLESQQFIFQQDNASIHTAGRVTKWFGDNNVILLPWPSKSPDLNIIENVWGYLSRRVYADGKQFETAAELKDAIFKCWAEIPTSYIRALYDSIPSRIYEVIKQNGGSTKY